MARLLLVDGPAVAYRSHFALAGPDLTTTTGESHGGDLRLRHHAAPADEGAGARLTAAWPLTPTSRPTAIASSRNTRRAGRGCRTTWPARSDG